MGFNKKNIRTKLTQDESLHDITPNNRNLLKDSLVQILLCQNRNQYIIYDLESTSFQDCKLEFIPNYLDKDEDYATEHCDNYHPYSFIVNIYLGIGKDKTFVCEINNFPHNQDWFTIDGDTKPIREQYRNISYKFPGGAEFITDLFFNFNDDELHNIKDEFTQEYVIINLINYYLSNIIISKYQHSLGITPYNRDEFIQLNLLFTNLVMSEYYKPIINSLFERDITEESLNPLRVMNNQNFDNISPGMDFDS